MSEVTVRKMTKMDVEECTQIHTSSFKGFFLTFLGPRFLKDLYTDILLDATGIAFVAEIDGKLAGFVAGTTEAPLLYRNLIRHHLFQFALDGIGGVIRKPSILPRLLRALNKPSEQLAVPGAALLMSIAVHPGSQGHGVGKHLVRAFVEAATQMGKKNVLLTTDAVDNDGANKFYQGMGFTLLRASRTPEGRVLNEYVCALPVTSRETATQSTAGIPTSAASTPSVPNGSSGSSASGKGGKANATSTVR